MMCLLTPIAFNLETSTGQLGGRGGVLEFMARIKHGESRCIGCYDDDKLA